MIKKLTFVGGGSTGHAAAAFFALRGLETTLFDGEEYASHMEAIRHNGGILLRGKYRGLAKIQLATTDPAQAIPAAEVIFINVVAERHQEVAKTIAPYLRDGQHIIICPGNLGCFVFRKVFQELGMTKAVTVSDLEGNLFPCRLTAPAEAKIGLPFGPKGIASLPVSDTPKVIAALEGVMELRQNVNVFDCAINSTNFVMHLAATLLSTSLIKQRGPLFNMFKEGLTPEAVACAEEIEKERRAVIEAMGLAPHMNPLDFMRSLTRPEENPQLADFISLDGPDSVTHRYVTEDALCSGVFCASVGRRLGVETPLLDALLLVAGAVSGVDYWRDGRTLENLGFASNVDYAAIVKTL